MEENRKPELTDSMLENISGGMLMNHFGGEGIKCVECGERVMSPMYGIDGKIVCAECAEKLKKEKASAT